jgi:hypothetical protein
VSVYTEKQTVAALRRLEKNWPEGYTLFSWSGSLCLMKDDLKPEDQGLRTAEGSHNEAIVATFYGISNDGGDPD